MKALQFLFIPALAFLAGCANNKMPEPQPLTECEQLQVTFAAKVNPIIQSKCAISGCHVSGGSGPGDFTTFADLKQKVDNGSFQQQVISLKRMPPSDPLPDAELRILECWLNAGAPNN